MSATGMEHANSSPEEQPLLRRGKRRLPSLNIQHWYSHPFRGDPWSVRSTKEKTAQFLSSKAGHYSVLTLVSLDVLSMIADFILNLFKCEQGRKGSDWDLALEILGSVSLVFSCLFVVELTASVWAFGWKYFNSWFHCFDAFIVIAGFITDVALRGTIEEVASLIVVMRLWRVVKIIEELGVGAQEQTEELNVKLEKAESENEDLRSEISRLKGAMRKAGLDQQDIGATVS
ncbi:voltage-gated hydrogen channel 1 [Fusarium coicis]|nr:voltage-gated hydrogen channel 1 [Fusarium coicis]